MKPNPLFHARLRRFIKSRNIKYSVAAKQIGGKLTATGLAWYCNDEYIAKRKYVEDKNIQRIKEWMKGIQLQEEAEASAGNGTDVPPVKDKDVTIFRRAKIIHALMSSNLLTQEEKEECVTEYLQ